MTAYGIWGDAEASAKLIREALNDQLDHHQETTPDDDFWLCLGVRSKLTDAQRAVLDWAGRAEVYTVVYAPKNCDLGDPNSEFAVSETHVSDRPFLDVVERLYEEARNSATVFALLGDDAPATDVARALARAHDSGIEIRDLAEAGLTYVRPSDDPLPIKEQASMANEDEEMISLAEAGALADEGNEEALEALMDLAKEYEIDPDDHADKTWEEFAELLQEAVDADGGDGDDGDDEPDEDETEPGELDESALRAMSLADLRTLAAQSGVDGAAKMRKDSLVRALLEGGDSDEPVETEPEQDDEPAPRAKRAPKASSGGADIPDEVIGAVVTILKFIAGR